MSAETKTLIAMARKIGMDDGEIMKCILANELGATRRRQLIVEVGELLGLDAKNALQLGKAKHLIPNAAPPRSRSTEKLL
jgi:hypothetical protein